MSEPWEDFSQPEETSPWEDFISGITKPIKRIPEVYQQEVQQGLQTMKQAVEEPTFGNIAKGALGGLQYAFSPLTALTKPLIKEPIKNIATETGIPEPIAEGIGTMAESVPYFLPIGKAIQTLVAPTPKGLELAKQVGFKAPEAIIPEATKEPVSESVQSMMNALQSAEKLTPQQKALYSAERGKRIQEAVKAGEEVGGETGYYAQLSKLKGELPKVEFETLRGKITQEHIDDLFSQINKSSLLNDFDKLTAQRGLTKLLGTEGGYLPNQSEIAKLREVFPKEFIDTLQAKRPLTSKLFEGTMEVLNLPRAVMASFDLSAPFRQGMFLVGRPKQFTPAFKDMFKYAFNEKAYHGMYDQIKTRPTYPLMKESKLSLTDLTASMIDREEKFMSNLGERIPIIGRGIHASNRAYTGFLNKLRADVFDDMLTKAKETGALERNPDVAKDIAKYVNSATGRGTLGELNKSMITLNAVFFSPRLMASRMNLINPAYYVKLDPFVRKEALKDLVKFGGLVSSILGLAKLGGADVEINPTSSDFGKMKIGNTRYDLWGGFQQYMVLASRLASGKMTYSTTGKEYELGAGYKPTTYLDIGWKFLQSKENPIFSYATKALSSPKTGTKQFNTNKEIIERFIPMVASDMYDLYSEKGGVGIPMATPGIFGVGVQTYDWRKNPSIGEDINQKITDLLRR